VLTGSTASGFSGTADGGAAPTGISFSQIDVLTGSGSLKGEATVASTWTVTAVSGNSTYADPSHSLTFSGFNTLNGGGSGSNAFNVAATGYHINGNSGTDTLTFTAAYGNVNATLTGSSANGYSGNEGGTATVFTAIDQLLANASNTNSLTGENATTHPNWNLAATRTYNDGSGSDPSPLVFANFQTLKGGTGGDTFNVTVTTAGVPLTLKGNGGSSDTFNVGFNGTTDPNDVNLTGSLANVAGTFTINGTGATLNVSDAADTTAVATTVTATDILSGSAGDIIYNGPTSISFIAGHPTGGNRNAIDLETLNSGTSLVLTTTGNSDVQLAQAGQDTSSLSGASIILAGTSSDTLLVNDQADPGNNSYLVSDSNVTTGSISVTINSPFGQEIVYGGTGSNTFDVYPSTTTTISVDGGSGSSNRLTYHTPPSLDTPVNDGIGSIFDTSGHYKTLFYYDFTSVTVTPPGG
jgi:hypothetical protein